MPTTLPERVPAEPVPPVGALAYVAVALAFIVLVCSTLVAPPLPLDPGQSAEPGPVIHGT